MMKIVSLISVLPHTHTNQAWVSLTAVWRVTQLQVTDPQRGEAIDLGDGEEKQSHSKRWAQ